MSDSWPRRRLLAILRGASEPLDAQELARVTGQHVTTVRFHLDVLTRDSLVRQFQQPPRGRGRPRIGYSAVQRSIGYLELAQVLADQLGADPRRRSEASVAAGRAWGASIDVGEHRVASLADAKDVTMTLLSELGFAPERDPAGTTEERVLIRLTACPLRELARTHPEVVCGVHLGLITEVLERSGGRGLVEARLDPFLEPELSVAQLELFAVTGRMADVADTESTDATAAMAVSTASDSAEPLMVPSAGRVAPQLRNTDAHIGKQSAQQW
ncbi:helix-turn-helix transcriptional regulator [Nocardia callitridis]|uniref:Transcriptional regulator n=1 Tax=Nocardia callitridis TaxID=648753 RepID=A0ABP9L0Q6_9NOCA